MLCTRFAMYAAFCRRCFSHDLRFLSTIRSLVIQRGWASQRALARREMMLPRSRRLLVARVTGRRIPSGSLGSITSWSRARNLLYAWLSILAPMGAPARTASSFISAVLHAQMVVHVAVNILLKTKKQLATQHLCSHQTMHPKHRTSFSNSSSNQSF